MTAQGQACARCGHALTVLRKPVRRLRWTRYWWMGVRSLVTRPLSSCPQCGAIYNNDGTLLAAGAVQTEAEHQLDQYRKDMAYLRDSFAGVIIAAEIVAVWLIAGPAPLVAGKVLASIGVGVGSFFPYIYFGRKARQAKKDLKALRAARRAGAIPQQTT